MTLLIKSMMTMTCEACGAKLFPAEVGKKQKGGPAVMSSLCCGRGKVRLPRLPELPPVLMQRMFPDDPPAKRRQFGGFAY